MTFLKRHIPSAIVFLVGMITLLGWFIDHPKVDSFVNEDAAQWYDIIASFAVFLGAMNLLRIQGRKILRKKKDWQYSLIAIGGFLFAFFAGFFFKGAYAVDLTDLGENPNAVVKILADEENVLPEVMLAQLEGTFGTVNDTNSVFEIAKIFMLESNRDEFVRKLNRVGAVAENREVEWGAHLATDGSLFKTWIFDYIFTPLSATMFALLAFFVASASFRAFRVRNLEATLLLLTGCILMLGRVPIADYIPFLRPLQEWIYSYPNVAGQRVIMIGIALGMVGTSVRIILGYEKSFMGDK